MILGRNIQKNSWRLSFLGPGEGNPGGPAGPGNPGHGGGSSGVGGGGFGGAGDEGYGVNAGIGIGTGDNAEAGGVGNNDSDGFDYGRNATIGINTEASVAGAPAGTNAADHVLGILAKEESLTADEVEAAESMASMDLGLLSKGLLHSFMAAFQMNPFAAVNAFNTFAKAKSKQVADLQKSLNINEETAKGLLAAETANESNESNNSNTPGSQTEGSGGGQLSNDEQLFNKALADNGINTGSGGTDMPTGNDMPGVPDQFAPGIQDFVTGSQDLTDSYNTLATDLWNDYLQFESEYFDKYEQALDQYDENIADMPNLSMTMPDSMGGASVPLAPKNHSTMYGNQLAARSNAIGNQGNAQLTGMANRDALLKNAFNVNKDNLNNALMPTQTGLDLYRMERASDLGIDRMEAQHDINEPSEWSKWAPVVGSVLSTDWSGTAGESAWNWGSDKLSSGWDAIFNSSE